MTASTTTSKSSRSKLDEVDGADSCVAAGCRDKAIWECSRLADELSADPLQLLSARVADFQTASVARAFESDRQPKPGLDVRTEGAQLHGLTAGAGASGPVSPHPVLGLAHREPAAQDHLQSMLLRRRGLERDESARVAGGDRAGADGALHRGACAQQ